MTGSTRPIVASEEKLEDEYEIARWYEFAQPIVGSVGKLEDEFVLTPLRPLRPFGFNHELSVRWTLEERERVRRIKEDKQQKEQEKERRAKAHKKVKDSILEYDPKVDAKVYTRFFLRDFSVFDIDEKSPILPKRYADSKYKNEFGLEDSANILSVSIVSSDVGFPVNVYGSVIARDSIDYKCIDLFRRSRNDCQRINIEGGKLVLTGPGRGLVLVDFIYIEIDLKIRQAGVYPDMQFSKGLISIDGRVLSREEDAVVRSETLDSFRSTMEVRFATLLKTVEGTFEIRLVEGDFHGKITAGISGIKEEIVIHDSETDGVVTCGGVIKLRRSVMTVCRVSRMLEFHFENKAGGVVDERKVAFTPLITDEDEYEFPCGPGKLKVNIVWSLMDFRP